MEEEQRVRSLLEQGKAMGTAVPETVRAVPEAEPQKGIPVQEGAARRGVVPPVPGGKRPEPASPVLSQGGQRKSPPVQKNIPARDPASQRRAVSSADVPPNKAPSPVFSEMFSTPGALAQEAWPASWRALKDRRPLPPSPLVLWTYEGLGEDLMGSPDPARRQVIVRMLTALHHPGGTHVFWPCSLPGEPCIQDPSLFWSGVRMLDPRVLLLFGSDTRDALAMPRSLLPFCQERIHGRLVVQLPRPQALAADEAAFQRAQAFLARLLSFCAVR